MTRLAIKIICLCLFLQSLDVLAQSIASTDTTRVFTMRGTYYSDRFVGRKTSSGEVFVQDKYTAAHHTLKFGTLLLVTNPKNGKETARYERGWLKKVESEDDETATCLTYLIDKYGRNKQKKKE